MKAIASLDYDIEFDEGKVTVKRMSIKDLDMAKRMAVRLETDNGYDPDTATTIAYILHGVESAFFPLTEQGVYDIPTVYAELIAERIGEVNDPLAYRNPKVSAEGD